MRPPAPLDPSDVEAAAAPFGQARMLPRDAYVSPDVLAWERRWLFDGGWVCVGRVEQLAAAGQSAVRIGATSVLVTSEAGRLATFANICRHRGHELLACGASSDRRVVQCPYHAWTYELDGRLRSAPHATSMPNVVPAELGLLAVRHHEWGGWLFVDVGGEAPAFDEHVGDLAALTAPWDTAALRVGAVHRYELAANWKVAIENYHECYHCPLIHPELCRVSPATSGVNLAERRGAFVGGAMRLADGATTMSLDGSTPLGPLPGLDAERRRQVLYVQLFPSLLLSLHPDYVMTHRITPVTASTSTIECQWLFAAEALERPGFDPSFAVDFWDLTNRQDWAAVESVQRGLDSCRFVPGVFAPNEDAVHHFASMIAAAYQGAGDR